MKVAWGIQCLTDQAVGARAILGAIRSGTLLRWSPIGKPYVDHFAFRIENCDQDKVETELKRRGFNPLPDSKLGWIIQDPDGMRIEVAGKRMPEYIGKVCNGRASDRPGGARG